MIEQPNAATAKSAPRAQRGRPGDYLALTKPRVTSMIVATTATGFYLGSPGPLDLPLLLGTLLGVGLAAAGTSAINQVIEREADGHIDAGHKHEPRVGVPRVVPRERPFDPVRKELNPRVGDVAREPIVDVVLVAVLAAVFVRGGFLNLYGQRRPFRLQPF